MFGPRLYHVKLIVAFGLFFGSCALADHLGRGINPSPVRAALAFPKYEGETLWIPGVRVERVTPEGFVVQLRGREYLVRGASDVRAGEDVELLARFHAPDRLDLVRVRPHRVPRWRFVANAVSVATVLVVLAILIRRFRVRRGAWEAKWPTS